MWSFTILISISLLFDVNELMDPSDQKAGMCESSWHMLPCIHHCIHASIHPSIPPYLATYLPTGRPTDIHTYMLDMSDTYLYTCVICIHAAILCQGSSVQVVCYNMLHTQKHLNAFVSRYTTSVMTIIGRVLLGLYKTRDKAIAARAYQKYVWHRVDVHSYDRADIMQSHPYSSFASGLFPVYILNHKYSSMYQHIFRISILHRVFGL